MRYTAAVKTAERLPRRTLEQRAERLLRVWENLGDKMSRGDRIKLAAAREALNLPPLYGLEP
jgi:hypothetical protein